MKPILILLLMTSLIHCEDVLNVAPNKHTPDVNRAIAQCETDVAKIKADAEKDILASNEKLRIVLVKGQEAATKKGDLDEALALKGMIEKLPKADVKIVKSTVPMDKSIVGTWRSKTGYVLKFGADKGATWGANLGGGWEIDKSTKPVSIIIKWANGCTYRVNEINGDDLVGSEENGDGTFLKALDCNRVKEQK